MTSRHSGSYLDIIFHRRAWRWLAVILLAFASRGSRAGQIPPAFQPVKKFALENDSLQITRTANPRLPFTVTGEHGAILGSQDGRFELWSFPVKVLDRFEIFAQSADYPQPIAMNGQAATIAVFPDHTTITYSHAAIVIKEHLFAPRGGDGIILGAAAVFEVISARPVTVTFRFEPALVPAWPAPNFGRPLATWTGIGEGGGYLLTTSSPTLFGLVAMPGTRAGALGPNHQAPADEPLEFTLQFDPRRDRGVLFPLLALASYNSDSMSAAAQDRIVKQAAQIDGNLPELYARTRDYYAHFFDRRLTIETPDSSVNDSLRWAELAIDQCKLSFRGETGLAAGWAASNGTARPGYGWFFGRDTLWSVFAIDSYGDFPLAREALAFLIGRQRSDGKIMHEFPQTADQVNWAAMPYFYASADSTPLMVMAMEDYVQASGDVEFLRQNWESIKRAYAFTRAHETDSVYDNSQGTGWVEAWLPTLPRQEIYLAALDEQSAQAISRLAQLMGDIESSAAASSHAKEIAEKLTAYRQQDGFYAFSRNADGSYDHSATIFPSVAWWSGQFSLPSPAAMLERWNSAEFATDWGLRSIAEESPLYDPVSYHQGSVWPLFTGWVALAEYRAGHSLAAYQELLSTINLSWTASPGAVSELLSGRFNEALDRSTAHQMWSSAMIVAPLVRGMLGIEADVKSDYLRLEPSLPAEWNRVVAHHIRFGNIEIDVTIRRERGQLVVDAVTDRAEVFCLSTEVEWVNRPCTVPKSNHHRAATLLHPVEVMVANRAPLPGSGTSQMKVLREAYSAHALHLELEAPGESTQELRLRFNDAKAAHASVTGATREGSALRVSFPPGDGYQKRLVELRW